MARACVAVACLTLCTAAKVQSPTGACDVPPAMGGPRGCRAAAAAGDGWRRHVQRALLGLDDAVVASARTPVEPRSPKCVPGRVRGQVQRQDGTIKKDATTSRESNATARTRLAAFVGDAVDRHARSALQRMDAGGFELVMVGDSLNAESVNALGCAGAPELYEGGRPFIMNVPLDETPYTLDQWTVPRERGKVERDGLPIHKAADCCSAKPTVVVANIGIWYQCCENNKPFNVSTYARDLAALAAFLEAVCANSHHVCLLRGTTAQHFCTKDQYWHNGHNVSRTPDNFGRCVAPAPGQPSGWRDRQLCALFEATWRRTENVFFFPMEHLSRPFVDAHPYPDCTHHTLAPFHWEPLWWAIDLVLKHRVPPLKKFDAVAERRRLARVPGVVLPYTSQYRRSQFIPGPVKADAAHGLETTACPACAAPCAKPYWDCAACETAECGRPATATLRPAPPVAPGPRCRGRAVATGAWVAAADSAPRWPGCLPSCCGPPAAGAAPRKYDWVPSACDLPVFDPDRFCDLLGNRTLLLVGDSTMHQTAKLLENALQGRPCLDRVAFGMSDFLAASSHSERGASWDDHVASLAPDIAILSTGSHWAVQWFEVPYVAALRNVLAGLRRFPRTLFAWKTLNPAGCGPAPLPGGTNVSAWLRSPEVLATNPHWHEDQYVYYPRLDALALDVFAGRVPVIDASPLYLRPDSHQGSDKYLHSTCAKLSQCDCLHFCTDGTSALTLVPDLILNFLEDLSAKGEDT